jgi:hypothetical protein
VYSTHLKVKSQGLNERKDKFNTTCFEIPSDWLAILHSVHSIMPLDDSKHNFKSYYDPYQSDYEPLKQSIEKLKETLNSYPISHLSCEEIRNSCPSGKMNEQTRKLINHLGIDDAFFKNQYDQ